MIYHIDTAARIIYQYIESLDQPELALMRDDARPRDPHAHQSQDSALVRRQRTPRPRVTVTAAG